METIELNGKDALKDAAKLIERFLKNPEKKIFFISGYFGPGKKYLVEKLCSKKEITPIEHRYTLISTSGPILRKIKEFPQELHLWKDVYRSSLMHPEILQIFRDIENGTIPFEGKFILVANDYDFPPYSLPPLPGISINMNNLDILTFEAVVMKKCP